MDFLVKLPICLSILTFGFIRFYERSMVYPCQMFNFDLTDVGLVALIYSSIFLMLIRTPGQSNDIVHVWEWGKDEEGM